jgi:hypothetical protein
VDAQPTRHPIPTGARDYKVRVIKRIQNTDANIVLKHVWTLDARAVRATRPRPARWASLFGERAGAEGLAIEKTGREREREKTGSEQEREGGASERERRRRRAPRRCMGRRRGRARTHSRRVHTQGAYTLKACIHSRGAYTLKARTHSRGAYTLTGRVYTQGVCTLKGRVYTQGAYTLKARTHSRRVHTQGVYTLTGRVYTQGVYTRPLHLRCAPRSGDAGRCGEMRGARKPCPRARRGAPRT